MTENCEYGDYEENNDTSLDPQWIKNFDLLDRDYETFYKEDNHYIKLHYVYVNVLNDIELMRQDKLYMKNSNIISREEIVGILKRNCTNNGKKYTILSILKYNIDIEPLDVKQFLFDEDSENKNAFLYPIKNIDTIPLQQTISMFQDLNDLFIIFYENDNENGKKTRNNLTKKIYITGHKKTMRKRLKVDAKL